MFSHAIGNCWGKSCISHLIGIPQDGNLMEKSTHTEENVWTLISQAFSIWMVLLHFYMLWGIDKKTYAFPMWWNILGWESNEKKALMLWKKYEDQFPRFSPYDVFISSCAMKNWWGNSCISHLMRYTTGCKSNRKKHP